MCDGGNPIKKEENPLSQNKSFFNKVKSKSVRVQGYLNQSIESIFRTPHKKFPFKSVKEHGRSMVEMLGVLALVGVLTVTALMGYNYGITRYKTITLVNDLNLRAVTVSAQLEKTVPPLIPGQLIEAGLNVKTPLGYPITHYTSPNNVEFFEMEVENVPSPVCRQIVMDYMQPVFIFVNDIAFKDDKSICDKAPKTTMVFVYPNVLGGRSPCSAKGFFDEASYKCKCAGNTYFNPFTQDCACPAGYVWNETTRNCVESKCKEGEFEDVMGECHPCEDSKSYKVSNFQDTINGQLKCTVCPQRVLLATYGLCILNPCEKGKGFVNPEGICHPCDDPRTILNYAYNLADYCNACSNRYAAMMNYTCMIKNYCPVGSFFGIDSGLSYPKKECYSCSDPKDMIEIGMHALDKQECERCTNAAGVKNRKVIGVYCRKTGCDSSEFMSKEGVCYSCLTQKGIAVNDTGSGCDASTCGRTITKGVCQLNDCPVGTHMRLRDGACYACDDTINFIPAGTAEECELQCPNRRRSDAACKVNACTKGVNMPSYGSAPYCFSCKEEFRWVGGSEWAREYCEACPDGNYLANGTCVSGKMCIRGEQFRRLEMCIACDVLSAQKISTHPEQRKMCTDCSTSKRFYASDYCYLCDSSETPVVTESDEVSACNACGVREVVNNRCVLKQ